MWGGLSNVVDSNSNWKLDFLWCTVCNTHTTLYNIHIAQIRMTQHTHTHIYTYSHDFIFSNGREPKPNKKNSNQRERVRKREREKINKNGSYACQFVFKLSFISHISSFYSEFFFLSFPFIPTYKLTLFH